MKTEFDWQGFATAFRQVCEMSSVSTGNKGNNGNKIPRPRPADKKRLLEVPNVPNVPISNEELAGKVFARVFAFATEVGPAHPPELEDYAARCINRLGGWVAFCSRCLQAPYCEVKAAFVEIFLGLLSASEGGVFQNDELPFLKGLAGTVSSYRKSLQDLREEYENDQ